MEQRLVGHFEKIEYKESSKMSNVLKHEIHEYEKQTQKEEIELRAVVTTKADITAHATAAREALTPRAEEMSIPSTTIQRLKEEILKTKEIIGLMKIDTESKTTKNHRNKDSETEELLLDMKEFQELLKIVQTGMRENERRLKEETSNFKAMKFKAKKQERELEQRLEKTLREKDELYILQLKMQKQTEMEWNKIKNLQSTMKKIIARNTKNGENLEVDMEETNIKIKSLNDMNQMIKGTKQELENICMSIMKEKADLEKTVREIKQRRERQSKTENVAGDNGGI